MTEHTHMRVRVSTKDKLFKDAAAAKLSLIEYVDQLSKKSQPVKPNKLSD